MKAILRNYRYSPRKLRLVADVIRGVSVKKAGPILENLNKKGGLGMKKLLNSAVANAKENFSKKEDDLYIKTVKVDEGRKLRGFMPRAFGRATPIHKPLSHITLELGPLNSGEMASKEKNKESRAVIKKKKVASKKKAATK